jgi:dienelactone hydrolase
MRGLQENLLQIAVIGAVLTPAAARVVGQTEERVVVESDGWRLVGDLRTPDAEGPVPAVLMLNKAAGDRTVYMELAEHLARRGIASLRLDLRGHGESVDQGRFVPGEVPRSPLIWDAERDVLAALAYLRGHPGIDEDRLGVVGGSYSGEEMAEAGRIGEYARAYVALSPGSFSEASIDGIDDSGVPWLFVVSRNERHLGEITAAVRARSRSVELLVLPGTGHATRLLADHDDLAERLAVWLRHRLGPDG